MLPRRGISGKASKEKLFLFKSFIDKLSQVLQCIGDLFHGANDIMNWLTACARLISKSLPSDRISEAIKSDPTSRSKKIKGPTTRLGKEQMTSVVWTTPLGLPVVQPYRKIKRKQVMTSLQSVYISDPNAPAQGELQFAAHGSDAMLTVYSEFAKAVL